MRAPAAAVAVCALPAAAQVALIGGAGCDDTDTQCTPPANVTDVVPVSVSMSGQLSVAGVGGYAGPQPSWLTAGACGAVYAALSGGAEGKGAVATLFSGPGTPPSLSTTGLTLGTAPVHTSIDRTGKWLAVANYGGCDNCTGPAGSVSVLPIADNYTVGDAVAHVAHHGRGTDPNRQNCAHVHSAVASRTRDVVYVADLGLDTIFSYALDTTCALSLIGTANASRPGAGPRHTALHPNGRVAYVIEEMACAVSVYAIDETTGAFRSPPLQTVASATNHPSRLGGVTAGELAITPDGSHLYASNRGDCKECNTVQHFRVKSDGLLAPQGRPTPAPRFPRGMVLAADLGLLLAAGQGDGSLASFVVSDKDGRLTPAATLPAGSLATPATIAFPTI